MAVIAMTSARGAPGVTTTALVAAFAWPRPVLLVEADVSGSSSIKAGHLRGEYDHRRSLINLALAHRTGGLTLASVRGQTISLTEDRGRLVLPGLATRAQADGLTDPFWESLATLLGAVASHGMDVLIDAGRLGMRNGPDPLLRAAELLVVVSQTALDDVVAVRASADQLPGADIDTAVERHGVVIVGEGQPHGAGEVAEATTLPVWASIAWDPLAAERVNGRERVRTSLASLGNSKLIRSSRIAINELLDANERRNHVLGEPTTATSRKTAS